MRAFPIDKIKHIVGFVLVSSVLVACGNTSQQESYEDSIFENITDEKEIGIDEVKSTYEAEADVVESSTDIVQMNQITISDVEKDEESVSDVDVPMESAKAQTEAKLIVIDAGHQSKANSDTEPIGPGADERKAKVSGGTSGVSTGVPEYELTLALA